jgi:alanyl-tRNA synthetase
VKSAQIREKYLQFFESKGAQRRPSSSLVPDDPSLLLTSAGMVQFKPVFLGVRDIGTTRATTCQKCVRTTDIEIIGHTGRHHSFFEMLGNFSFGDYFKTEAAQWAWEFSVDVLGLDPERVWITIFEDDDEAEAIWRDVVGVPPERIVRMGAEDNFWAAGPTGPCGPCSELYYDRGEGTGCGLDTCKVGCDCDRFVEYWNLVFMQYNRLEDGTLEPLPKRNIDTGMGLERMASILQGAPSNFETDIMGQLMELATTITGVSYGESDKSDISLRIIADHARAVTFMIADGILPANEGRGYVLRRLLRRAVRHGRILGVTEPFLATLVAKVVETMGDAYPEIVDNAAFIGQIVAAEETRFGTTLRQGLIMLDEALADVRAAGGDVLPGEAAFTLHDTYGFPLELTEEIVAEQEMTVDLSGFKAEMEAQRERGRAAVKDESWALAGAAFADFAKAAGTTEFVGYTHDETDAAVLGIVFDGHSVATLEAGVPAEVVLDRTSFYGEQGGQVGDTGTLTLADGSVFEVSDTRIPVAGVVAHIGALTAGTLTVGDTVHAAIDVMRRERIRRNHTATHLLHWALRLVLGEHVKQSGSMVAPDRLRFDFTHFEGMTREQIDKVERLANAKIMENHPVRAYETSLTSARETGVTALFGEKYGDIVRVLEIGNFSKELCGGTHVSRTSEINVLKIVSEGSVGASLRRIEAVTSFDAFDHVRAEEDELRAAAEFMKVQPIDVSERAATLVKQVKELQAGLARTVEIVSENQIGELVGHATTREGYKLLVTRVPAMRAQGLRETWDILRVRLGGEAGVVLAAENLEGDGAIMLAAATPAAVAGGFDAGSVMRSVAPSIDGRGGGKPAMAQAGGERAEGIDEALAGARTILGIE